MAEKSLKWIGAPVRGLSLISLKSRNRGRRSASEEHSHLKQESSYSPSRTEKLRKKLKNQRRFVLVGLDNAGKTTLLQQMCLMSSEPSYTSIFSSKRRTVRTTSCPTTTVPTMEFDIKTIKYKSFKLHFTDVGGQDTLRRFWRHHFTGIQGVVFVVDSSDEDRISQSCGELELILKDEQLNHVPILIFGNKQDINGALSAKSLKKRFMTQLSKAIGKISNELSFQEGSGLTNQGIFEGLDWLCRKSKAL